MATPSNLQGFGLPWFSEAEWHAAKAAMEDGHTFHDSYAEFVAAFEKGERRLQGQGHATVRVALRMSEFVPWCAAMNCKVDAHARAEYAALKVMEADRGRSRR